MGIVTSRMLIHLRKFSIKNLEGGQGDPHLPTISFSDPPTTRIMDEPDHESMDETFSMVSHDLEMAFPVTESTWKKRQKVNIGNCNRSVLGLRSNVLRFFHKSSTTITPLATKRDSEYSISVTFGIKPIPYVQRPQSERKERPFRTTRRYYSSHPAIHFGLGVKALMCARPRRCYTSSNNK